MSTLAEIEAAVSSLNAEDLQRLETLLRELRQQRMEMGRAAPTNLGEFEGVLRLTEDPLGWQRRLREEWQ